MKGDLELSHPLCHVRIEEKSEAQKGSSPEHVGALSLGSRPPGRGCKCLLWIRPLLGCLVIAAPVVADSGPHPLLWQRHEAQGPLMNIH